MLKIKLQWMPLIVIPQKPQIIYSNTKLKLVDYKNHTIDNKLLLNNFSYNHVYLHVKLYFKNLI